MVHDFVVAVLKVSDIGDCAQSFEEFIAEADQNFSAIRVDV